VLADGRFALVVSPTARRHLTGQLPEAVAFAAYEFVVGPLLDNPRRVGKRLRPPLDDRHSARRGTYRVIYRIDDTRHRVTVVGVFPRADASWSWSGAPGGLTRPSWTRSAAVPDAPRRIPLRAPQVGSEPSLTGARLRAEGVGPRPSSRTAPVGHGTA
jgi:mRNA interferase RelE/StbE